MESKNKIKENEWLKLLKEAIDEGVKIQVNHRFKYKNKNLGGFLTHAKRKNNPELHKKIKRLGVDFKMHSKDPEHYLEKFTLQLLKDKKPIKQRYMTRFNVYILPKKDILKEETIEKLNNVWQQKFGVVRKWDVPETALDKINKWKAFRYDEENNPDGKWFHYRKYMGNKLYGWVYIKKRDKKKMSLILEHFNEQEIAELKKEGFF